MPAKRKYKCLNSQCSGTGRKDDTGLFIAMNAPSPECPCCGTLKVEDWGDAPYDHIGPYTSKSRVGTGSLAKGIDATLRRQADRYGLTNMSNNGGAPVKSYGSDDAKYGTRNYFGVDCPIGDKPVTVSGGSPFKVGGAPNVAIPGSRAIPGNMTTVHAEHKG